MPIKQDFSNEFQTKCRTKEGDKIDKTEDYKELSISCAQPSRTITTATKNSNLIDTSQVFVTSQQDDQTIDKGAGTAVCQPCRIPKLDEEPETKFLKKCDTAQRSEDMSLYRPVTAFVDTNTDISALIQANCSGNTEQIHVVLSGLHTCGDLSPSMIRLFIANPSAHVLCNVPCCHHLLTEEFEQDSIMVHNRSNPMHYGFPMSSYLRSKKTKLGGVARMMACMAAEKLAYEKKPPTDKLFYRAVLQVILKEHYTIPTREQRTGKLASKCSTFVEYTRRALKKMGYQEDKLSDEVIEQYYDTYKPEMKKLEAFNQVRAALAPSIEAVILLDKMCFLKEQDSVQHAYLVPFFDPIKSPRCYGIIAVK